MANLKEIRTRIESVESTRQITTAMRMVSASKFHKAQMAFSVMQLYVDHLLSLTRDISTLMNHYLDVDNVMDTKGQEQPLDNVLLFVFSSNRGLCGSFNANIAKYLREMINQRYQKHLKAEKLHILTAGRRVGDILEKEGYPVVGSYHEFMNKIDYKDICELSNRLLSEFKAGTYQKIILIYNKFKTILTQELTEEQFLPIVPSDTPSDSSQQLEFIMEPDQEAVLKALQPRVLSTHLYRIFLESLASEESARMTAMQHASDNATALLKELKLTYNKARQATITNELIEIISGSITLNK